MTASTPGTLGHLQAADYRMHAECGNLRCRHMSVLDLEALIRRFGAGHVYVANNRIGSALRCGHCGHRGAQIFIVPGGWTYGDPPRP